MFIKRKVVLTNKNHVFAVAYIYLGTDKNNHISVLSLTIAWSFASFKMEILFLETMRRCEPIVADGRTKLNQPSINDKNNQYIIRQSNMGPFYRRTKLFSIHIIGH